MSKRLTFLESVLFDLDAFAARMVEQVGIDPRFIYCAQTGEPIGRLNDEELQLAIHMAGTDNEDELIDDLMTRTLMAMRPSVGWNIVDSRTLNRMRVVRPRQLLSHLMIRLYTPKETGPALKLSFEQRMTNSLSKIQIYQICAILPVTDKQLNRLLLTLLRIDSTFNMNEVAVKTSFPGLANIIDDESFDSYMKQLLDWESWLWKVKARADKADKTAREYWSNRGSSLTRVAAAESFKESTPPSETAKKKQEKKRVESEFLDMLEEIIEAADSESQAAKPVEPAVKPVPGVFKPGQFKLNLARK